MKFSGSNFQSWSEFDLEISGLTVVTGVSNRGKSALFRALKGLLRNELGANYVRLKQKEPLELTLKTNGHEIKAERPRDGSTSYVIDGKPFTSLARAVPEDLKKLGYEEITVGEFKVDPIFSDQSDPHFLLDKRTYGPGMLNAILGAFGGTEKLELGKKEANLRITQKNGEAKTLSFEIAEAHARAAKLAALVEQGGQIAIEIHTLESSARALEHRAAWTRVTDQIRTRLSPLLQILSALDIPDTSEVEQLQAKVLYLNNMGKAQFKVQALDFIESGLGKTTAGWSEIVSLYKKARALQDVAPLIEDNENSTRVADASELNAIIGRIEDLHSAANRLQASIRLTEQAAQLRARVADLQHQRLHVETEQDAASKMKCPQCGTEF
jgi:DNA repair ATPase RecN